MSADNWTDEHHLTRNGWEKGTATMFNKVSGDVVRRPDDAIETWSEHCYQRSMWSRDEWTHTLLWHHPGVDETERLALRAKFTPPPFAQLPKGWPNT
jgi:hypothetical protein